MHNPATNSGGICLGEVREIGPDHPAAGTFAPGDRVATLVSLTLTPLKLEEVGPVVPGSERLAARGTAILFARTLFARLPDDLPEALALAAFDVCGAPARCAATPGTRKASSSSEPARRDFSVSPRRGR